MTNQRSASGFFTLSAQATAHAAVLSLVCFIGSAQAQDLHLSRQLRVPSLNGNPVTGAVEPAATQADFIVAVVNSEPITNSEVRTKLFRTEQQMQQQGVAMPSRNELLQQVLERMINDRAQLQLAKSTGLKIEENAVQAAVETVARQNDITVDELRRRLKADGIAYSQFESELRNDLLVSRLRQREVDSRTTVTEAEIDQFLKDQRSGPAMPVALNLGEILIAVPENATPAQVTTLQAKAQQVFSRAQTGADFTQLVNEFSEAPSRTAGGVLGLRTADRYPSLFVEATKNLQTGGLAGLLRSGAGFHILKVLEKKQGNMPDTTVTQTHARHILLRLTPKLTEAAAIEKLADFKKRVQSGQADFATLARENSDDGSVKEGGDLGWVSPGLFVPEFETVMNALAPNQISDPLVSRFGVHLIQVLERRETQLSTREQREVVRNMLRDKKRDEAYVTWAQEVRGRAYVEYRDPPARNRL